jgi:hypothetical protein
MDEYECSVISDDRMQQVGASILDSEGVASSPGARDPARR